MSYNPGIPIATDLISTSQGQILANFNQIGALYGSDPTADHFAFDDATVANRGLHKTVTFPAIHADPGLANPAASLYTKTVAAASQLFFQNGAVAADVVQLTGLVVSSIATGGGTSYGVDTPWGLKFRWGSFLSGGNTVTISFTNPTNFTTVHSCVATIQAPGLAIVTVTSLAVNQVVLHTQNAANNGFYFAIGV